MIRIVTWMTCLTAVLWSDPTLEYQIVANSYSPPLELKMGEVIFIPQQSEVARVLIAGREMTFLPQRQVWAGVLPKKATNITFIYKSQNSNPSLTEYSVHVQSPALAESVPLRLPSAIWKKITNPEEDERRKKERLLYLNSISTTEGPFLESCYRPPTSSAVTSQYGSPRTLPDGTQYHHMGEDRRAAIGNSVRAIGDGEIVFAGDMLVPGQNVVIHHGGGWFSRYLHLSELKVAVGDRVQRGQVIAKTGASGRVEAPHLHWEVVWKGIPAHPSRFLQAWAHACDPRST